MKVTLSKFLNNMAGVFICYCSGFEAGEPDVRFELGDTNNLSWLCSSRT